MIYKLRKRHRHFFFFMSPLVVLLMVLSLYFRPPISHMNADQLSLLREPPKENRVLVVRKQLILEEIETEFSIWKHRNEYWGILSYAEMWQAPDILVYWQRGKQKKLSTEAYLLGPLLSKEQMWFALPSGFVPKAGTFILYSLGHSKVLAAFHL